MRTTTGDCPARHVAERTGFLTFAFAGAHLTKFASPAPVSLYRMLQTSASTSTSCASSSSSQTPAATAIGLTILPPRLSPDMRLPSPSPRRDAFWELPVRCPRCGSLRSKSTPRGRGEDLPPMEEVTLFYAPCGDPALVATFLNAAFPRLSASAFHAYPTKEVGARRYAGRRLAAAGFTFG